MLESLFPYITFRTSLAGLTSLIIFISLGKFFVNILRRNGMGQRVSKWSPQNHFAKEGTPTSGGIFIFIVVVITCLIWSSLTNKYFLIAMLSFTLFTAIGFVDDILKKNAKRGFSIREKLILQLIASSIITYLILRDHPASLLVPFSEYIVRIPKPAYFILLVLIITGASNAVNLTDGLDGLAISHVLISLSVLLFFVYVAGHSIFAAHLKVFYVPGVGELSVFLGALLGACLGFLWFNAYPAEVFLGDSGSLSLGAFIGVLSCLAKIELFLPIFGGIFVVEAISVLTQVFSYKLAKRRVFKMAPLHHHFELSGWPEPKVTIRFIIVSVILAAVSIVGIRLRIG